MAPVNKIGLPKVDQIKYFVENITVAEIKSMENKDVTLFRSCLSAKRSAFNPGSATNDDGNKWCYLGMIDQEVLLSTLGRSDLHFLL